MSAVLQNNRGKIVYSDDCISSLAGVAATECYGVVGMSSKKATDGIVQLLKGENLKKGVIVTTDNSEVVTIDLFIIVEYGVSIAAVASSIIQTVKYKVEKATGLIVKQVNVMVNGIRV